MTSSSERRPGGILCADVTGTGFTTDSAVAVARGTGSVGRTPFIDPTHLQATIDVAQSAHLGPQDVSVDQLDAAGKVTSSVACRGCLAITAFAVTSVDPLTLTQGDSQTFDITGAGFAPATSVLVRGKDVTVGNPTFIDSTHLRVRLTAAPGAAPTARRVDLTSGRASGATVSCPACLVTIVPSVP